jgi:NADPH-dependent 2,4-dienoyl-CoA reductase/sulfur reductase-like enzyme
LILPYYIGDTIKDREQLFAKTPEEFSQLFNLEVRILNEVLSINKEKKSVRVKNISTNEEYEETYDKFRLSGSL